jgi:hypothetical protein
MSLPLSDKPDRVDSLRKHLAEWGLGNPWVRVLVFAAAPTAVLILFRPRCMFTKDGYPRPFKLLSGKNSKTKPTWFPIYLVPVTAGLVAMLL